MRLWIHSPPRDVSSGKIPTPLFCLFLNKCRVYYWIFSNGRGYLWLLSTSSCSAFWNSPQQQWLPSLQSALSLNKKVQFYTTHGKGARFSYPSAMFEPGCIFWVIKKLRTTSPQCQGDFGGLWNSLTCWCFVLDIGPCSDMNCPVTIDPPKMWLQPPCSDSWSTSVSDNVSHGSAELHGILGYCAADTSWGPDLGASALCSSLVR